MFAARRIQSARLSAFSSQRLAAGFHNSAPAFVKVGDRIPDVELMEGSPGNKVSLAKELKGKGLIIGVPAAYSPSCSESHIPGYINSAKLKDAGSVFVVSVNDAFVMKAWGKDLDPSGKSGIRFLADPSAEFTKALDLSFDGKAIFGGDRSKRYTLVIEDGAVKEAHVEPDNTGLNVSAADKVLG
ncbi:AhpC/TSA family protein [Delitschia confertaspora ATCC 74209]|uniref:AhpC/TSA family protein n=1 Tax=Delitschia confertaspora ATCC 74209 TaxID=1513339 RepID=A0A9P4JYP0_9PLEO|nr:AhpC/TSA family protein [Delitschia confertaspora ATCC 74209]